MDTAPLAKAITCPIIALFIVLATPFPAPSTEFLYVHNTYSGDISKIAIPKHEVVATIPIGRSMDYITPSPDEQILYVNRIETLGVGRAPNIGTSGELIALSTKTDQILWRMDLDGMPHHMAVSKDGKHTKTVHLPALPENVEIPQFYPHNVNHGIELTPDEKLLFVNASIVDYVAVYTHPRLELQKTIPVGTEPNSIRFSNDGTYAYISNRKSDEISVIHVADLEERKRIPIGNYPQRMAVISIDY